MVVMELNLGLRFEEEVGIEGDGLGSLPMWGVNVKVAMGEACLCFE